MFDKFMNSYYYGKAGKGDYTPEDLPKTRWQLFLEMLRTRMSELCRLNLTYVLVWLPAMIVLLIGFMGLISVANETVVIDETTGIVSQADEDTVNRATDVAMSMMTMTLAFLIPAIGITGPFTAGISYVTRNWARDEHAFIWSDYKDAVKANWKPALVISLISGVLPIVALMCWQFYGAMSLSQPLWVVPQMLTIMVCLVWSMAVTYMYPMLVTYKMNLRTVIRNSMILAIGRLPLSAGVRLLHCVPVALALAVFFLTGWMWALLALLLYYVFLGFSLSRFITASVTNAVFDKYINSRIEGASVNRGLSAETEEDDEDDDDDDDEERELKPWENGYTDRD